MLATLASAASLIIVGKVVDHFSVAKVATVVCIGLAAFCYSITQVSSVLGLGIALFGLRLFGQGLMTHTAMTAMGRWYERERGRAVSITSLGHQIGDGLLPILVVSFIAVMPWTKVWQGAALLILVCALPLIVMVMRVERHPRGTLQPGQSVLAHQYTRGEVMRDPIFWILCIGTLAPAFISTSFFFHQQHIGEVKGWSLELIAASFSLMAVSNVVFSLTAGVLVDKFSAKKLLPYYLLPLCAACLVLSTSHVPSALWLHMVLLGASGGVSNTLLSSIWPEAYGTQHLGAIRSVVMAGMVFSSALGPGVTGWLIDQGVAYPTQTAYMAVYCLMACAVLTWVSRKLQIRAAYKKTEGSQFT